MARIYYHKNELKDKAFESEHIDINHFNRIMEDAAGVTFELEMPSTKFSFFQKSKIKTFRYVYVSPDDIEYNSSEGNFYLPSALIFTDKDDYPFPTEFYFLAKLGNQLELRVCHGGEDVVWHQIPDLHQSVSDAKSIEKIENTLVALYPAIDQYLQDEKERKVAIEEKRKHKPQISDEDRDAYAQLISILAPNAVQNKEVSTFIQESTDTRGDFVNKLNTLFEEHDLLWQWEFDWKSNVEDFVWGLNQLLAHNFPDVKPLEVKGQFELDAPMADKAVFQFFNDQLLSSDLQMTLMDIESDSYVVLIHKIAQEEAIVELINKLGLGAQRIVDIEEF